MDRIYAKYKGKYEEVKDICITDNWRRDSNLLFLNTQLDVLWKSL